MSEHKCEYSDTRNLIPLMAENGSRELAGRLASADVARCPSCGNATTTYRFKPGQDFGPGEHRQLREASAFQL